MWRMWRINLADLEPTSRMRKAELEALCWRLIAEVRGANDRAHSLEVAALLERGRREAAERDRDAMVRSVEIAMMELPECRSGDVTDAVREARMIVRNIEQREAEDATYEGRG